MQEKRTNDHCTESQDLKCLYNDDVHSRRKDFLKHHLIEKPHAAGHEFSFRTTKYPAVVVEDPGSRTMAAPVRRPSEENSVYRIYTGYPRLSR